MHGCSTLFDTVTGCADLKLPSTYWVKRGETEALVGCYTSSKTWRLVCKETAWIGDVTNCSDDIAAKLVLTSAAYHVKSDNEGDDINDDSTVDFTSSLPTGLLV